MPLFLAANAAQVDLLSNAPLQPWATPRGKGGAHLNLSSLVGLACRLMGTGWAEFAQGQRDGLIRVKLSLMAGGCE